MGRIRLQTSRCMHRAASVTTTYLRAVSLHEQQGLKNPPQSRYASAKRLQKMKKMVSKKEQQIKSLEVAWRPPEKTTLRTWSVRKGVRKGARKLVRLNKEELYCCIKTYWHSGLRRHDSKSQICFQTRKTERVFTSIRLDAII